MADAKTTEKAQAIEWRTVNEETSGEETKIIFNVIGDEFVGVYLGLREVAGRDEWGNPAPAYSQARFSDPSNPSDVYFTNCGYSLRNGLKDVRKGSLVRITWTSEQDTGQASPMRVFRVDVAANYRPQSAR